MNTSLAPFVSPSTKSEPVEENATYASIGTHTRPASAHTGFLSSVGQVDALCHARIQIAHEQIPRVVGVSRDEVCRAARERDVSAVGAHRQGRPFI